MVSRIGIVLLLSVLLSGCFLGSSKPQIVKELVREPYPVPIPITCPEYTGVGEVTMRTVEFAAVQDAEGIWWIALSTLMYENLSKNTEDIITYIKSTNKELDYYKECIKKSLEKVDTPTVES